MPPDAVVELLAGQADEQTEDQKARVYVTLYPHGLCRSDYCFRPGTVIDPETMAYFCRSCVAYEQEMAERDRDRDARVYGFSDPELSAVGGGPDG